MTTATPTCTLSHAIARFDLPEAHRDVFQWPETVLTHYTPQGDDVSPYVRTCQPSGLVDSYFRFTLDDVIYCVPPAHSLNCAIREQWQFLNYGRPRAR